MLEEAMTNRSDETFLDHHALGCLLAYFSKIILFSYLASLPLKDAGLYISDPYDRLNGR